MAQELDVYREWLGIKETNRPLNCYQLLRIKPFTDDAAGIRARYRQMNGHVRKFASGEYQEESQNLLNELAKAMLCLTDAQRKKDYDISLGRKVEGGDGRRREFEEILLANQTLTQEQMAKARSFSDAVGLDLHQAVVQQKLAEPDVVMLAYAESIGIPYVELDDIGVDEALAAQVPPPLARQHSCVPVMEDGGNLLMASPNPLVPDVEEELRLRFEMPIRTVLCTAASINAAITKYYPKDAPMPVAPTKAKAAKSGKAKKAKKAVDQSDPETLKERKKQRLTITGMGFGLPFAGVVLLQSALGNAVGHMLLTFGIAFVLGAVASGIAWVVTPKFQD